AAVQLHRAGHAADDRGAAQAGRRAGGDGVSDVPRLCAEHLRLSYDGRAVVDDVSLTVPAGAVLGIAGPNGSGKTSLLRMLSGEVTPEHGEAHIEDHPVAHTSPKALAKLLAMVSQDEGITETPLSA